ncbi:MAG TPA: N-acetylmuramoyl-L-alanine amidase [Naasia sp.]|jgi:hypothetical protein
MVRFDGRDLTALSESQPRTRPVTHLQTHHGTVLSYAALRGLMDPGGRQVSSNAAMTNDGRLIEVVPWRTRRAFTSASAFDHNSFTVECCNQTLGPRWEISRAVHERLARLAADMHLDPETRMPLTRAHIVGHKEVPGSYPTVCPGPCMDLDWVTARSIDIAIGDLMAEAVELTQAAADAVWSAPKLLRKDGDTPEALLRRVANTIDEIPAAAKDPNQKPQSLASRVAGIDLNTKDLLKGQKVTNDTLGQVVTKLDQIATLLGQRK